MAELRFKPMLKFTLYVHNGDTVRAHLGRTKQEGGAVIMTKGLAISLNQGGKK
jgi:hypothetical protein